MKRTHRPPAHDDGFTLMELMAVVLVIGILLAVAIATFVPATRSAAAVACRHNQRVLEDAYTQAECTTGVEIPEDIDDLAPYVDNINRVRLCPLDGVPLEFDADTGDVSCINHS